MRFKISIHCGQMNTFIVEDHDDKISALDDYHSRINSKIISGNLMRVGDVLVNPKMITFVVVEDLILEGAEPVPGATVEA